MTTTVASREVLPKSARHTYSPESATESCESLRRDPDIWGDCSGWHQLDMRGHQPLPCPLPTYLVLGWEGPATLVPGESGLALVGDHAVKVQGLSLGDGGC